jgi:glycosyltransferase involved in cell wall biosynthesis
MKGQEPLTTDEIAESLGRPLTIHYLSTAKENFFYNMGFQMACLKELPMLCKRHDFDIIHSSHPHMPDLFSRLMRRIKIPTLVTVHEVMPLKRQLILKSGVKFASLEQSEKAILTLYPFLRLCEILYFKTAPLFIAPSRYYARILSTLGIRHERIKVIPNGVDTSVFSRMNAGSHDRPTVLFAGRFVSQKGIETIIDAIPRVLHSIPHTQFVFTGAGMPARYLDAIKSRRIPNDSVRFLGYINNYMEMPRVYSLADVYILPSVSENCPMSLLEAMSCETAVIAGNGGGTPEIVESGEDGLLIPPRDSVALADSTISLLQDRRFAARLGRKARKKIIERFSAEVVAGSTMRVYEAMHKYDAPQKPRR